MQDRIYQIVEIFLHRTAGPYIGVNRVPLAACRNLPINICERTLVRPPRHVSNGPGADIAGPTSSPQIDPISPEGP